MKIFDEKLNNLRKLRRMGILNKKLLLKVVLIVVCCVAIIAIFNASKSSQSQLKGFDPFEILGVGKDATL